MTVPGRDELIRALPYARRYARALTGSQAEGDRLVADSVKAILSPETATNLLPATDPRFSLYAAVSARVTSAASPASGSANLSLLQRQLLLLTSLEEVGIEDAAAIVAVPQETGAEALGQARERLRAAASAAVLIIEDEPIIAMDIEELVISCGHRVVGIAATEVEAVEIARRERPSLILADINLGAGGDGTLAVARILRDLDIPVIFVTAYPERLLTGQSVEPAYVITKPFEPVTLAITTYQAVTGGVRLD